MSAPDEAKPILHLDDSYPDGYWVERRAYTATPANDYEVDMIRDHASFCSDLNLCGTSNKAVLDLIARIQELKNEKASVEYHLEEMTLDRNRWRDADVGLCWWMSHGVRYRIIRWESRAMKDNERDLRIKDLEILVEALLLARKRHHVVLDELCARLVEIEKREGIEQ